jgi:cerevisin
MLQLSLSFVLFLSFFKTSFCKNYILTPKTDVFSSNFVNLNIDKFSKEHDLEVLAKFDHDNLELDHLQFYTTSHETLMKYKGTLSQFYYIEEDVTIHLNHVDVVVDEMSEMPWHLDRVDQGKLPLDNVYLYNETGSCHRNSDVLVDTYIVDTGIDIHHSQFEGRAQWSANMVDKDDRDCNSHGTHVAGLVGSKDYGVCKDANLYAVKVLNCEGSGSLSGVIKGIDWVFKNHLEKKKDTKKLLKSIINMSLGGGSSQAVNRAVEYCVSHDNDFYIVVAAGNENEDACDGSPSGAKSILTVMASDASDNRAWFSNWGECADIYSPGVNVLSTIPNEKTAVYSGTSMATPVVVGVLNHYLDVYTKMNMKKIIKQMLRNATKNAMVGNPKGTTNFFVNLNR